VYSQSNYLIEQMKEIEIGVSCGTCVGVVRTGFWWGNIKESLGVGRRIILKLILHK
jgi:hypothetical protein